MLSVLLVIIRFVSGLFYCVVDVLVMWLVYLCWVLLFLFSCYLLYFDLVGLLWLNCVCVCLMCNFVVWC